MKSACRIQRPAAMPAKLFTDRTKEGSTTWVIPGFHLPHQDVIAENMVCFADIAGTEEVDTKRHLTGSCHSAGYTSLYAMLLQTCQKDRLITSVILLRS